MKWIAIVNPHALKKRHIDATALTEKLSTISTKTVFTEYHGHAGEITQKEKWYDGIIVVSGDGTLHDVISHIDYSQKSIGLIPAGTGNSLGRDLGLRLLSNHSRVYLGPKYLIDLMTVDFTTANNKNHHCISASTIAIGYPAGIGNLANKYFKFLGSQLCYPTASIINAFRCQPQQIRICYNSQKPQQKPLTGLMLTNTNHTANAVCLLGTRFDDGQAEAVELNAHPFSQILHNLSIISQRYFYDPSFHSTFTRLRVELEQPNLLTIDGDIYEQVISLEVELLPSALNCYACTN